MAQPIPVARLLLRPFTQADSAMVQTLVSDAKVAQMAGNLPYPYPEDGAKAWIATHAQQHRAGTAIIRAMVRQADNQCVGAISLDQIPPGLNVQGNLGYWVGVPYWNNGYCAEAGKLMLQLAARQYHMQRVVAAHRIDNPASGRVLEKLGFEELEPQRMTNLSGEFLFRCYEKLL